MKAIAGTFNGTGAALTICCGFVPNWVKICNLEDADCATLFWNIHMMRSAEMVEGVLYYTAAGIVGDPLALADTGVIPHYGGTVLTAASTVYLGPVKDSEKNQCKNSSTGLKIAKWTLGSSTNMTGNWDNECNTTFVGEGSLIKIDGKIYGVNAVTSNGEAANEVTLSSAAPSGVIEWISPMYDYIGYGATGGQPLGVGTKAGFQLSHLTVINVSGELCMFEAGNYD